MNLTLLIYLADIVESFSRCLILLAILGLPLGMFTSFLIRNGNKDMSEPVDFTFLMKAGPIIALIMLLLASIVPSKEGVYLMAASEGVQAVAANPKVQSLASNSLELLERKIKEELNKTEPKKEPKDHGQK